MVSRPPDARAREGELARALLALGLSVLLLGARLKQDRTSKPELRDEQAGGAVDLGEREASARDDGHVDPVVGAWVRLPRERVCADGLKRVCAAKRQDAAARGVAARASHEVEAQEGVRVGHGALLFARYASDERGALLDQMTATCDLEGSRADLARAPRGVCRAGRGETRPALLASPRGQVRVQASASRSLCKCPVTMCAVIACAPRCHYACGEEVS